MKTFQFIICTCLILIWTSHLYAQHRKELIITTSAGGTEVVTSIFEFPQIAYKKLGYDLTLVKYPSKRTFSSVHHGKADGVLLSTPHAAEVFDNLLLVPPSFATIDIVGFSYGKEILIDGFKSLAPYKIGIMRGYELTIELTRDLDQHLVNNWNSLYSIPLYHLLNEKHAPIIPQLTEVLERLIKEGVLEGLWAHHRVKEK